MNLWKIFHRFAKEPSTSNLRYGYEPFYVYELVLVLKWIFFPFLLSSDIMEGHYAKLRFDFWH